MSPSKPPRICPKCRRAETTERYCQKCTKSKDRRRESASYRKSNQAFYRSATWKAIKTRKLTNSPFCEWIVFTPEGETTCNKVATVVDHIIPRRHLVDDSPSNLQSLCASHHGNKNEIESGRNQYPSTLSRVSPKNFGLNRSNLPFSLRRLKKKFDSLEKPDKDKDGERDESHLGETL